MKRVIFIGQAMPRHKLHPHHWPSLNKWLYSIGLTDTQIANNFLYTALLDYFPGARNGSHLVPTSAEIQKERSRLTKTIRDFHPETVVTIGKLSLAYCLRKRVVNLRDFIGKTFAVDPYGLVGSDLLVIPLPHPSGASTWSHKPGNKRLLKKALDLLKSNLV